MKKGNLKYVAIGIFVAVAIVVIVKFLPRLDVQTIFKWYSENLNYGTVTLLMAIESSFIPFPSEIVVPPAAYFAQHNDALSVPLIVAFATLGALIGAVINYVLAMLIGRPLVYKFANSRIGNICLINEEKVVTAEKFFEKHGAASTFFGRLVPAVRQLISIPAGLARMNFAKFAVFTALGAGIWNSVLAGLGYWLSTQVSPENLYNEIEHYNHYLNAFGYGLGIVIVAFIAYQFLKKKNK